MLSLQNFNLGSSVAKAIFRTSRETLTYSQMGQVKRCANELAKLDEKQFKNSALEFRNRVKETLSDQPNSEDFFSSESCNKALAYSIEGIRRTLGFTLHDCQIQGAFATARGNIIEMRTGEGKTLVCGVASYLRSLVDCSVHVATTNDYLAQRDYETVQPMFELLGTPSASIGSKTEDEEKAIAYRKNITYGPGYLFGFDYLKDQLRLRGEEAVVLGRNVLQELDQVVQESKLMQLKHQSIIVDEADSILIDESTTPLILSGAPDQESDEASTVGYTHAQKVASELEEDVDYTINRQTKQIELTDPGLESIHQSLERLGRFFLCLPWQNYIQNALFAVHFLKRDHQYVVQDQQIKLVDEFTGRIFDDRTLQKGLHQAVEAKEQIPINPPNQTLARITRQRFFQLYDVVCGMTGTAANSENELKHFYKTNVVVVPPNVPDKRISHPTRFFRDFESKLRAIGQEVLARHKTGQPILIGTRTIEECRLIFQHLESIGVKALVLNGVQDEQEADIISDAGQPGAVTIATNMAGRGTDIKLNPMSLQAGGLHVIGTQCFESPRIDRQLAGRSARQGDPGSCQFFLSADDVLIERNDPRLQKRMIRLSKQGESSTDLSREVAKLQSKIEKKQFEMRKSLVQQDKWLDQVRETFAGIK